MLKHLESSIIEKDVENAWRQKIQQLIPESTITSPYNTDGYLETNDGKISLLLEFKYDENFKSKLAQVNALSQTLYYLKKFEKDGKKLPKVIVIADKNECFILHSNPLSKYLDYQLNWGVAASTAFKVNPELISEMLVDSDINPFVFDIVEGFNFNAIKNKIIDLSQNITRLVKVTEHNINNVFEYFQKNVLGKNALSVNEVANLFVNLIINPGENYLHPKRKNILITKSFGDVYVHTDKFISFFSHFDGEQYSIREKEKLTSIVDRIVEDETRRRKGEFFTPTIWVDEAHKMISEAFGENWKEEYVVWDPACGTLNLTRDYRFGELYCSTIEESDLKTAEQMKYNPEAVKFQYDFLNDGIVDGKIDIEGDTKLPEGLKRALIEGKKIIVLMNPPYKRVSNISFDIGKDIEGDSVNETKICEIMKCDDIGNSVDQLYTQFLYRLYKLNSHTSKISVCIYSPSIYLTGSAYYKFRKSFLKEFCYENGFLFHANHFDSVSKDWAISFSIFKNGINDKNNKFLFSLKELNTKTFEIYDLYEKNLYNLDDKNSLSFWLRIGLSIKSQDFPNLSSAIKVVDKKKTRCGKMSENAIGFFFNGGNNIETNWSHCCIFTSAYSGGLGISIFENNIFRCFSTFSARNLIRKNWTNGKDEYMAPNESHPLWQQFQYDSIVYSLFNTSSNQSSLRQIDYKGKKWDIKNEFFWMSKEEMMELGETKYFDDLYRDARQSEERYVYKLLFEEGIYEKLSPDAKEVLDLATELVKTSFDMREILHGEHPEYHLQTWDAGWYQIKLILKAFYPDRLKEFTQKYKQFEDRMRPLVYELGFLRK